MAFKKNPKLDTDVTIQLGGNDRKTGKPNPKQIEGYYLGSRSIETELGMAKLHVFETEKGNVGVWGKTDLNRQLSDSQLGYMTRVTQTGMRKLKGKKDMYTYDVETDEDLRKDIGGLQTVTDSLGAEESAYGDADEELSDEVPYAAPRLPAEPVQSNPSQARKVQELLNARKAKQV